MSIMTKVFGDPNEKIIKGLRAEAEKINSLEPEIEKLSDDELKAKTNEFKKRLADGASLSDIKYEAFAVTREAAKRTLGQRHYDVQLIGGLVLNDGNIAEMKTGEGKTLTSTAPIYLNALDGKGVHVITVNDYLAKRDTVWMGQIFQFLGLSVGCIQHEGGYLYDENYKGEDAHDEVRDAEGGFKIDTEYLRPANDRHEAYKADITYGTNNEFGFDYLRDNMVQKLDEKVQRELNFAIVDEVDSILIDEARTPLIISAPAEESAELYYKFAKLVVQLRENEDYNIDEKMRATTMTDEGIQKMENWLGVENLYVEGGVLMVHHIENALRAHALFKRDKEYVVRDGQIVIVDEFTGRMMEGRRYSEGLHQAIEAKEGVDIQRESRTMATVTFQNYFRMYNKLSGMTGTAATEAEEFAKIYGLDVTSIPTNKPLARIDSTDRIYRNELAKFKAVAKEIKKRHEAGQPVLVGTISIEKNEILGELLKSEGIPHNLLNAKNHEGEGETIAQAGRPGGVTIATNMAGRGVDIILGGNPPGPGDSEKVHQNGGLHVIGTERHESRRIDNQLRGRSGRQGDPGSTQFFVSLDDDLMRIFGSDRMRAVMERLKIPEDMPIENKMITGSIEKAQHKVEGHHFDVRKRLLEYDDVLNKHRETIYRQRDEILSLDRDDPEKLKDMVIEMIDEELEQVILFHTSEQGDWNVAEIIEVAGTILDLSPNDRQDLEEIRQSVKGGKPDASKVRTAIIDKLEAVVRAQYEHVETEFGDEVKELRRMEKGVMLRAVDSMWVDHLTAMSYLRTGIGLRGYGQRDPLIEYKKESFGMFNQLTGSIRHEIVYNIFKVTAQYLKAREAFKMAPSIFQRAGIRLSAPPKTATAEGQRAAQSASGTEKVGRNEPCTCGATKQDGSPKKYKHCCGKNT